MTKNYLKNTIKNGEKNEKLLKIKFDSKTVYCDDEIYIKIKIKTYGDSIITNFYNKIFPKENTPCKFYQ